jgi:DNA-binding winged helix-turn-helix (wHTH) protein/TolB-like protein
MTRVAVRNFSFAPFVFDAESGDLFRNGHKLRIPEQAVRLLTILLEHAGAVVTREELRQRMWPGGEHLNHDHSISNAINQLRNILRDNSRAPVFIETIPKRGYRFMAEVDRLPNSTTAGLTVDASDDRYKTDSNLEFGAVSTSPDSVSSPVASPSTSTSALDEPEIQRRTALYPMTGLEQLSLPQPPVLRGGLSGLTSGRSLFFVLGGALLLILLVSMYLIAGHARVPPQPAYLSLGIAPFDAEGPGARELADGSRLDLTDALSQVPKIQVRAAHSFSSSEHDDASIRSLAKTLQLDYLLFGKLSVLSNRVQLELELVRGRDAVHLSSFHYSGTPDELASIRDEVQRDIFARLESNALNSPKSVGGTDNPKAYENYLIARAFLLRWTDEPLSAVLEGFKTAVALDPRFAKAYSEMASAYVLASEHGLAPREDCYSHAEQMATQAIALDPSQAEAHAALGFIHFRRDWDAKAAERELRQAVELEPNQAIHHVMLALLLGNTGRFEEGLHQIDLAHEDDPLWPPVYLAEMYLASSAHRNTRSINAAEMLLHIMPDWPLAQDQRGWALWYAGRYDEAIAAWRSMALLEKDGDRLALENQGLLAFHRGGVPAYAQVRLQAIESRRRWAHPNDFQPAEWYLIAGDRKDALSAIREMINQHDPEALQLAVSPAYTSLHNDPAFLTMLSRVGLALPRVIPRA